MRLLLRETVDQLGTIGDIVEVPDGYGRNYLLPKGIAVAVTAENIRKLERTKTELLAAEAKRRGEMQRLAEIVAARSVVVQAKAAGEEGRLYGSVTAQAIAEAFQKEGVPIEPKMVLLDQPIKELGVFNVRIRLYAGIEAEGKVWVVEENAGPEAIAAAKKGEVPAKKVETAAPAPKPDEAAEKKEEKARIREKDRKKEKQAPAQK